MEQRKPSRGEGGEEERRRRRRLQSRRRISMPCFTGIDKEKKEEKKEKEKTTEQKENIYALFHRHR